MVFSLLLIYSPCSEKVGCRPPGGSVRCTAQGVVNVFPAILSAIADQPPGGRLTI
jgi:hypothetical protein